VLEQLFKHSVKQKCSYPNGNHKAIQGGIDLLPTPPFDSRYPLPFSNWEHHYL